MTKKTPATPTPEPKEDASKGNETSKIDFSLIPDNTVTIIVKNKGRLVTTGLTLPEIAKDTPEEDLLMAMQRVKDAHERLNNTVFYTWAGNPPEKPKPELA